MIENFEIGHKGKLTFTNGDIYDGFFKNGMKNGYGVYIYHTNLKSLSSPSINKYEGQWVNDQKDGQGKEYTSENQEYYEGNFTMGKRDAFGRRINSKGEVYIGQWRGGERLETTLFHEKVPVSHFYKIVEHFMNGKKSNEIEVTIYK
jgi:hypothetical protein